METLLNTIINNLNVGLKPEVPTLGSLNIGSILPEGFNVQQGQSITLTIDDTSQVRVTVANEKQVFLPQAELNIEKISSLTTPVTVEAKVTQIKDGQFQLQIQNINNQSPQQYIKTQQQVADLPQVSAQTVVVKNISGLSNIQLSNVNLVEIAAPYVLELPVPPQQKAEIQAALRQIEIKMTIPHNQETSPSQISPMQPTNTPVLSQIENKIAEVTTQLPNILNQKTPIEQTKIIQSSVQQLADSLQEVVGQTIPSETTMIGKNVVFSTPLGDIRPQLPVQIPENIIMDLEIADIIFSEVPKKAEVSLVSTQIEQTLQNLKSTEPQLFSEVIRHLPSPDNENLLQQMTNFVKAADKGSVRQWLGDNIVQHLENQGSRGQEILNDMQNILQQSHKQNISWRIIEIPYYAENHIDTIRLAIKQYPEDKETPEEQRRNLGTRFVVDTNFTQLGAFQFDGFSVAKERRFDLVIRTERAIEKDLYTHIVQLFRTTLNDVNYAGNIKINLKENFIKISETNDEDKFLPRDLFI
ncbi:MAG: hypothetical protein IJ660_07840 [Alphaproteobacteria bacterium]|nr:hypothetical protein [Alphaproteobacteria bacterium]